MNRLKSKKTLINWDLVSVNPNNKNWDWKDLFCFWAVCIQSVIGFSLVASLYVVYNLNTFVVFFGTILGVLLVYFFSNWIGKPSQKFGLPFVVLLRTSLGFKGAKYFGLIRALVGIFMFGIQTYFLSKAFSYLIRIAIFSFNPTLLDQDIFVLFFLGLNIIDWLSILISISFQAFLFSSGMLFNKKLIQFSAITVYVGMTLFFFIVFLNNVSLTSAAFFEALNYRNFFDITNLVPLITIAGTIFSFFSVIILSYGDFSRYVKNEKELKKGNLSLILNLIIFSFFTLFIVVGVDTFLKQGSENISRILTNPTDIIGTLDNLLITNLVLLFIIVSSVSTNLIANFIPSQYSLINFVPSSFSLKRSSFVIAVSGFIIAVFWLTYLSQIGILSFIDTIAAFFGPLFGIMVTDFYLIKKENLVNKDIYSLEKESSYYYSAGWNIKGVYSLILGFIFSASSIWNVNLMFLQPFSWLIGTFVTAFIYYLLARE